MHVYVCGAGCIKQSIFRSVVCVLFTLWASHQLQTHCKMHTLSVHLHSRTADLGGYLLSDIIIITERQFSLCAKWDSAIHMSCLQQYFCRDAGLGNKWKDEPPTWRGQRDGSSDEHPIRRKGREMAAGVGLCPSQIAKIAFLWAPYGTYRKHLLDKVFIWANGCLLGETHAGLTKAHTFQSVI